MYPTPRDKHVIVQKTLEPRYTGDRIPNQKLTELHQAQYVVNDELRKNTPQTKIFPNKIKM
jgi:hypothetical protein